jgi:hypothetical protein
VLEMKSSGSLVAFGVRTLGVVPTVDIREAIALRVNRPSSREGGMRSCNLDYRLRPRSLV